MKTIKDYKNNSDPNVIIIIEVDNIKTSVFDSDKKTVYEGKLGECPSEFDDMTVFEVYTVIASSRAVPPDYRLYCGHQYF